MEREGEEGSLLKGWSCETNWTVAKGSSSSSCRHLRRRDGNPWRLSRLHLIFSILDNAKTKIQIGDQHQQALVASLLQYF